eukprot:15456566-Alexandrium_andersonii.AAC.1
MFGASAGGRLPVWWRRPLSVFYHVQRPASQDQPKKEAFTNMFADLKNKLAAAKKRRVECL